jgi:hypothetical protein
VMDENQLLQTLRNLATDLGYLRRCSRQLAAKAMN